MHHIFRLSVMRCVRPESLCERSKVKGLTRPKYGQKGGDTHIDSSPSSSVQFCDYSATKITIYLARDIIYITLFAEISLQSETRNCCLSVDCVSLVVTDVRSTGRLTGHGTSRLLNAARTAAMLVHVP